MPTHRSLRMAEAIREVVATAILFDVADPRVRSVTVLRVEVSSDLRFATVLVSIMGNGAERKRVLEGLQHATGFLQARVAARLQARFTPVLSFKQDDSVKKSAELTNYIDKVMAEDRQKAAALLPLSAAALDPSSSSATAEAGPVDSPHDHALGRAVKEIP
jgi:ribosome-binding factor A